MSIVVVTLEGNVAAADVRVRLPQKGQIEVTGQVQVVLRKLFDYERITAGVLAEPAVHHRLQHARIAVVLLQRRSQRYVLTGVRKILGRATLVVLELAVFHVLQRQIREIIVPHHLLHFRGLRKARHLAQRDLAAVLVVPLRHDDLQVVIEVDHLDVLALTERKLGRLAADVGALILAEPLPYVAPVDVRLREGARQERDYQGKSNCTDEMRPDQISAAAAT